LTRLFGTDGVRGIANQDLSPELAFKLGQAGARLLGSKERKGSIVVGKDTRISGDLLEAALVAGICSAGVDALRVGVLPTPAIAYLTKALGANSGVVISASHNPADYNGIKFFDAKGFKLPDGLEDRIEVFTKEEMPDRLCGARVGISVEIQNAAQKYIDHLMGTIPGDLSGFSIALDCANGAAFEVAPAVFREMGASVLEFGVKPDGLNINYECGSTNPQYVQEIVKTHKVDVGLSFDGDADRVIAVDECGEEVDGDFIMAVCAVYLKGLNRLPKSSLVTTVMTNMGFDLAMEKNGIHVIKTKVGDRYVLEEMVAKGIVVGGEQSGHVIFLDHTTTGDGLVTAIQLLNVIRDSGKPLSELGRVMKRLPQILLNVEVPRVQHLKDASKVWSEVEAAQKRLEGRGRILVRPSGTEPLVRVMVESDSQKEADEIAHQVASVILEELGEGSGEDQRRSMKVGENKGM
jgi:phosphoglucosamine mutase